MNQALSEAQFLLSAAAVRDRAERVLELGLQGRLDSFLINLERLPAAVDRVVASIRRFYPSLRIPFHSRWRHFETEGRDRWDEIASATTWPDTDARARAEFDLAIVSVLLDAGAGADWRYWDGRRSLGRSEGLAIASLDMFARGAFSHAKDCPFRVDADLLDRQSKEGLAEAFQVDARNQMTGIEGRVGLLQRLGSLVRREPGVFGRFDSPRPGGFFDHIKARAIDGKVSAPVVLAEVLSVFGAIWPSRLDWNGMPLGDCWRLDVIGKGGAGDLVPLHKLSQWLTYSLIEPLQRAGLTVTDLNGLTGLAEYRNGGLFLDTGVLELRDSLASDQAHRVDSPLVIEWRALTVALLDRTAVLLREKLGLDEDALPLAGVLQGGTWTAGRAIAAELRKDAAPPLRIVSDGTVF